MILKNSSLPELGFHRKNLISYPQPTASSLPDALVRDNEGRLSTFAPWFDFPAAQIPDSQGTWRPEGFSQVRTREV